jgi:CheY-like chemotaxis protein
MTARVFPKNFNPNQKAEWDITIAHASSANEGLALFDSNDFDAVLLDYRLPDIDGMEVLHLLVKHPHHHAAVIILTGASADEDLEREFIEAGA